MIKKIIIIVVIAVVINIIGSLATENTELRARLKESKEIEADYLTRSFKLINKIIEQRETIQELEKKLN